MRKFQRLQVLSSIALGLMTQACGSKSSGLYAIVQNGKWGFMDHSGKLVINPQFDGLLLSNRTNQPTGFVEGLAAVKIGGKCGYIDTSGKYVINPQFSYADNFVDGLANVHVGDKSGFIDKTGKLVINPQYTTYEPFHSGDSHYWEKAENFSEGLAPVIVGQGRYEETGPCTEGSTEMCTSGSSVSITKYIDKTGKIAINTEVHGGEPFSEGLARVRLGNNKYGYMDKTGKFVIQPQFPSSEAGYESGFSDGLAVVKIGGKEGYIDKTGKVAIRPQFDRADRFWNGMACVALGKYPQIRFGFIDKTGKYAINPQFEAAGSYARVGGFSEGLAAVRTGGKWGYVDQSGKFVINPQFDDANEFVDGLAPVLVAKQRGYIDKTGKYIWNPAN
jgi:hypothetical protein